MARKKKPKRSPQNFYTERREAERPFVERFYLSIEEIREAWNKYQEIQNHTERRIYYVTFEENDGNQTQLFFIAKGRSEVADLLVDVYLHAHIQSLNAPERADPRPRLEYEIAILHVGIEAHKSFLTEIDSHPSGDARYQELRQSVVSKLEHKESLLAEKCKYLQSLKDLTRQEVIETHMREKDKFERKIRALGLAAGEEDRQFIAPERPLILDVEEEDIRITDVHVFGATKETENFDA